MNSIVFLSVMFVVVAAIVLVVIYGLCAAEDRGYAAGFKDGQNSILLKRNGPTKGRSKS